MERISRDVTAAPDPDVDGAVRAEQVRVIFEQAPLAQLLSVAVAGLLCLVLWDAGDRRQLVTWWGLLTAVTVVRMALVLAYRRRPAAPERIAPWERAFLLTLAGTSLTWGVGGWLIMPGDSLAHQAIVFFFLMGIAGGAVANYSAHVAATTMTIACLMLPATVWFALQTVTELRAMAIAGLIYQGAAMRATRTLAFFLRRNFQLSHQLQASFDMARQQASTDELTGLRNRRAFYQQGVQALEAAKRYERPLSLVLLDLDHFKRVNDTWGHAAGDEVLKAAASCILRTARTADIVGRLGGEEFAILLPETDGPAAARLAERLRHDIAALAVPYDGAEIRVTCSLGVSGRGAGARLDDLLNRADEALYEAKSGGRDRVRVTTGTHVVPEA